MSDGRKDDAGKDRWSLLPVKAIKAVVRVLTYGAEKYDDENWRKVPDGRRRYYDAALRHIVAWWDGEQNDPESNLPHLAHAACCIIFLMEFDRFNKDDSTKPSCLAELDKIATLQDDWDADGAVAPSSLAIDTARSLIVSAPKGVNIDEVCADAMGGVALYVTMSGSKKAHFECANNGHVFFVCCNHSDARPCVVAVDQFTAWNAAEEKQNEV